MSKGEPYTKTGNIQGGNIRLRQCRISERHHINIKSVNKIQQSTVFIKKNLTAPCIKDLLHILKNTGKTFRYYDAID